MWATAEPVLRMVTESIRYIFKLHALDTELAVDPGASREQLLTAMRDHVLADTQLTGKYKI